MHPLSRKAGPRIWLPAPQETVALEIQRIRRDGGTQGRVTLDQSVVEEYSELMKAGVEFPPVRVWFDGNSYWLSDGFQRVAATELIGVARIVAEVFSGSLEDATWDSFAANSRHGLRRTRADISRIIDLALRHPRGSHLSHNQLARHLNIPEATLRRRNKATSSADSKETNRIAVRNGRAYSIETAQIGKVTERHLTKAKSWDSFRLELRDIKDLASPQAHTVLAMIDSWLNGRTSSTVCLEGIEMALQEDPSPGGTTRARGVINKGPKKD